ncbi:MAG: endonuclease III [Candidatus Omnitrophica bacterium]|nr:endonuclease III [Candidatus Omnitrophota bacterium]
MTAPAALRKKAERVLAVLKKEYPGATCSLRFSNPFELLIATILSAQCTDERVNKVTPGLFKKYPDAAAFARAPLAELESAVRSTGFYKNKARNIRACAEMLAGTYGGEVPAGLEALVQLPGVGRKTANVVLGVAFGKPAVVVDTHVIRLSNRLGFAETSDAVKIEFRLMECVARKDWSRLAHLFIDHGRAVCKAIKPRCGICNVKTDCDYYRKLSAQG